MKAILIISSAIIAWFTFGCSSHEKETETSEHELHVFASIPPVAYFAERIGGAHVRVSVLLKPGENPHSYEPTPRQIMELGGADIYLRLGMPFENQLIDRLYTGDDISKVVDVDKGITRRQMVAHHDHIDEFTESESRAPEPDPHTWLSPRLIKVQARTITEALSRINPSNRDHYKTNLAMFLTEIDSVHRIIETVLKPHHGRSFYTFHPAFGYLADEYGLVQEAVEIEGKSPSPRALKRLVENARNEGVRIIFVQPQFDDKSARAVAQAINGAVIPMDAMKKDVLDNLCRMAEKIDLALKEQGRKMTGIDPGDDEDDRDVEPVK